MNQSQTLEARPHDCMRLWGRIWGDIQTQTMTVHKLRTPGTVFKPSMDTSRSLCKLQKLSVPFFSYLGNGIPSKYLPLSILARSSELRPLSLVAPGVCSHTSVSLLLHRE